MCSVQPGPTPPTVVDDGEALKTTSTSDSAGSTSAPTVSSIFIATTPGSAAGNDTLSWIAEAVPSRNSGVDIRIRSRSRARACASSIAASPGLSAGSASSGFMNDHFVLLSAAGGSPEPNVLSCRVQSTRLNQSPES